MLNYETVEESYELFLCIGILKLEKTEHVLLGTMSKVRKFWRGPLMSRCVSNMEERTAISH